MQITEIVTKRQYDNFEKKTYLWLGYRITLETASMCVAALFGAATYDRILYPFTVILSLIAGFSVRAFLEMPKHYFAENLRQDLARLPETRDSRLICQLRRCEARIKAAEGVSHTLANCFLIAALVAAIILCGGEG